MSQYKHPSAQLSTQSLNSRVNAQNYKNICTRDRPAEFTMFANSADGLLIEPKYPQSPLWINGVTYYLEDRFSDAYGINRSWQIDLAKNGLFTEDGYGGMLDFSSLNINVEYLIWAVADDTNTAFLGFGITKKPIASVSAFTGGSKGGLITCTVSGAGDGDALRFNVGGRVIVRNTFGILPNYEFNQGIITSIPNNTTIVVQLDNNAVNLSTAITSTTGLKIKQISEFVLTDGAGNIVNNSRLVGEIYRARDIYGVRHVNDAILNTADAFTTTIATPGSKDIALDRFFPPWTTHVAITLQIRATTGTWSEFRYIVTAPNVTLVDDFRAATANSTALFIPHSLPVKSSSRYFTIQPVDISSTSGITVSTVTINSYTAELR